MLTNRPSGWLKGRSKRNLRGYSIPQETDRCEPRITQYGGVERRKRFAKSIRNAAYAFLPEKKSVGVIRRYSSLVSSNREAEFRPLMETWIMETGFHSSLTKKFMHPAYQTIMAMGTDALPFIFRELQKAPGHWFYALRFIVQKDVAKTAENFDEARELWLKWGRDNRYIK